MIKEDLDIELDIEAAIWAWINFGGIGARTRRGCGALYCLDPLDLSPPSYQDFKKWLTGRIQLYGLSSYSNKGIILNKSMSESPALSLSREWVTIGNIYIKTDNNIKRDALLCWKEVIKIMKDFRQGNEGRDNGGSNNPGRSRWPEAESIRNIIIEQRALGNRPSTMHPVDERIHGKAFPRAEFGMPIIFELRKDYMSNRINIKPTLQPSKDQDRMASPLILRPIKFEDGSFASMILRLHTPSLSSAYLKPGDNDLVSGYPILSSEIMLNDYKDSPIACSSCTSPASALDAFISFAQSKDKKFTEVFS